MYILLKQPYIYGFVVLTHYIFFCYVDDIKEIFYMVDYYLITAVLAVINLLIIIFIFEPNKINYYFMILLLLFALTNGAYLAIAVSTSLEEAVLANKICYLGGCFMPPIILFLVCSICNYRIVPWLRCVIYIYSSIVYLGVLTIGFSNIYYDRIYLEKYADATVLGHTYGPAHKLFYIILYGYLIVQVLLLVYSLVKRRVVSKYSLGALLFMEALNISLFIGGRIVNPNIEIMPLVYVINGWVFLYLYRRGMIYNVEDNIASSFAKQGTYGYIMLDTKLNYLGCNRTAKDIFHGLSECVVDHKIDKIPEMTVISTWISEYSENARKVFVYENGERHFECRIEPIMYGRKVCGYMVELRDDTDRWQNINLISKHNAELQELMVKLEKAKEEAEGANKAKSDFLACVSHEIRTPVNAMLGMNEMILRESKDAEICNYASDAKNSALSLLSIINELLDSSKIESGMMEIIEDNYHLRTVLNDLYSMISIRAKEKELTLTFDVDEKMPREYCGDAKRIKQVVLNILTNAVKYTIQGSILLKVSCIKFDNEEAVLRFSVKDTGIGIKKENIGKIYDAFQRFDVEKNKNIEGTGLGMNIVQQLLKLMDSELEIESEYGKGSEFSFEIVQKVVDTTPIGDFKEKTSYSAQESGQTKEFTAPDAKVLVVDDNKLNIKVFKALVKKYKIQAEEAMSGKECLALAEENRYDMIFLDHMMPDMDGIETFHIMKEKKLCENIPVIMLTANAIVGDRERYLAEGFDSFMSKPIVPQILNEILLQYLPEEKIV